MELIELTALAEKIFPYDLTEVVTTGIIGNRADALRGSAGQKLWQTSKKWYQKKVANLDVPVNATLQRAIRRSYLTSLVQTCDQSILFIQLHETGDEYLASQRTKLQALYHKLKRTLPTLCSFPLSDADYQIRLIEIIRIHLMTEIEQVATQEKLPDNPADTVFDQLVLWDYTLSERHLLLQDEVHGFVLHELKTTRGLDVPDALATLLQLGWLHQGEKQTFFELMCRNFSEEIKHEEGVSEIFNAKLLAMLGEKMEVVLQEVMANQAGIQRMETQLHTLPEAVADQVVAKMASIDFSLYQKYRQLNVQLSGLDATFTELSPRKQKLELKIETTDDDETRELLAENLKELSIKLLSIDQKRIDLRKELTVFEDDVLTTALSLYSKPTDSPRLQRATTLFEQGDLEGANRVLDPEELERDKLFIEKAEAFLDLKRQSLAQEYMTKAKLIVLEKTLGWFDEATRYYNDAVTLHKNLDNCFAAAYFFQTHNQHTTAACYYNLSLKYVADDSQKASILNNCAMLHADNQQLALAEKEFDEALNTYRTLANKNPEAYLPYVADTLNNIANLHKNMQQLARAEVEYKEALNIYQKLVLVAGNSVVYLIGVAKILHNLALLHSVTLQLEWAEKEYGEALVIRRQLATIDTEAYLSDVAMTLNNLANLHSDIKQLLLADTEYIEVLDIYRKLAVDNPMSYLPNVAMTLHNLAYLHSEIRKWEQANEEYGEALDIRRKLATDNPEVYIPYVAMTLNNLGLLHFNTKRFKLAEQEYIEGLGIYRELSKVNPGVYISYVATVLNNMVNLHLNTQQFSLAKDEGIEALYIRRKLAEVNPEAHLPDVAMTLHSLAALHSTTEELGQAEKEYTEAIDIRRKLAEQNPQAFQLDFAATLLNSSIFYMEFRVDKEKSLDCSLQAWLNSLHYQEQVPLAQEICKTAIQIWQDWGEDLQKHLADMQSEDE